MASFNRVILAGNLTRDVELRHTASGTAVADIGMAINDRRKQGEEWIEEATFVDVVLWSRTAEVASEYLSKGSCVLIEGRLKLDQWEQDGQKRSKLKVVGERMQMLDKPQGGQQRQSQQGQQSYQPPQQQSQGGRQYELPPASMTTDSGAPEDDLPF